MFSRRNSEGKHKLHKLKYVKSTVTSTGAVAGRLHCGVLYSNEMSWRRDIVVV